MRFAAPAASSGTVRAGSGLMEWQRRTASPTHRRPPPPKNPPNRRNGCTVKAPDCGTGKKRDRKNRVTADRTPRPAIPDVPYEESVMQITIQGHQVDVTPALREYATSKLERVGRHFAHLHELSIVLGIEKVLHKAEATMQFSGRKSARTLHANASAADMYA